MDPLPSGILLANRVAWLGSTVNPLPGWCSPEKAVRLAELVMGSSAMISVDLGVFGARSTLALAEGHRAMKHGYVTGIDPWTKDAALEGTNSPENDEWWSNSKHVNLEVVYRGAMDTMQEHAVLPHWQILRLMSRDAVGFFSDGSIGVLHQDSNHSPEVSQEELRLWTPKMAPGALWIMDDTDWPSLQDTKRVIVEKYGAILREEHAIHSASGLAGWQVYQLP